MNTSWPNRPYRGLAPYLRNDAALFVGRDAEIAACRDRVLRFDSYIFVIHGQSGTGKSSFLRAGLLPHLSELQRAELGVSEDDTSELYGTLVVRSGSAPLVELADVLWERITLLLNGPSAAKVRQMILDKARNTIGERQAFHSRAGETWEGVYLAIRSLTQLTPARFNIVIDQLEEAFFETGDEARRRCGQLFELLFRIANEQPHVRLLIGMRTEFKAKLDEALDAKGIDRAAMGSYQLMPISKDGLLQAILRPSDNPISDPDEKVARANYQFAFEPGLAEIIQKDLIGDGTNPSSWLPVMQVICDRLYAKLPRRKPGEPPAVIRLEEYRSTGACSAQIASHLDEKLVQGLRHLGQRERLAEQADRWKSVLLTCTQVQGDGHVTVKAPLPHAQIAATAARLRCVEIEAMLEWLGREENYVLQKILAKTPEARLEWRLIHDILAVAIVEWNHSEHRRHDVPMPDRDPILETAHESYIHWTGPVRVFSTINDMIWDHQIALFAQAKGFSQRLGFKFEVEDKFDLTRRKGQMDYEAFVSAKQRNPYRMLILPLFMLTELKLSSWTCVGMPNIYRGYAILGPQRDGLQDLHGWYREERTIEASRILLEKLAAQLADPARSIAVFEDKSMEFVNLLLKMTGRLPRQDIQKPATTEDGKPRTASRDILFSELVASRVDFALGPAPSRALAEQAGFVVYADFEDMRALAEAMDTCGHQEGQESMNLDAQFKELLMPEGWLVDVPSEDRETLLRLTALMFYTVDYIRRNPEDFISFLYDQCLLAQNDEAFWLQRSFIRRAVDSCYVYRASVDYGFATAALPQCFGLGSASVYTEWLQLRAACDGLIAQLLSVPESDWSAETKRCFRRARKNYRIYNYFDAETGFRAALEELRR